MQASGGITWTYQKPLIPNGKLPSGRGGASLVYADGKLVTFGGHYYAGDDKFEYLDETWLLDTEKLVWHKMPCSGQIPPPRYGHSAHLIGSRMFIFGGKGPADEYYKDIYFLDLVDW
jgi:N-acetylneuraminic acid mutarotase